MKRRSALSLLAVAALPLVGRAAGFPSQTISVVVPFLPGGVVDPIARVLAKRLGETLNSAVIVENKPGAAGAIATKWVARDGGDGHMILVHTNGITSYQAVTKAPLYDIKRDLAPVQQIASAPYLIVSGMNAPFQTLQELVTYARAHPGQVRYGSPGVGTSVHMATEFFQERTGVKLEHIPFKTGADIHTSMLSGDIHLCFDTITGTESYVKSGRMRALAVTASQRWPTLPDVPTSNEAGVPGVEISFWLGTFISSSVPSNVSAQIQAAVDQALAGAETTASLAKLGLTATRGSRQDFTRLVATELERWEHIARTSHISLD